MAIAILIRLSLDTMAGDRWPELVEMNDPEKARRVRGYAIIEG